jgi:hypothetical protein
VTFKDLQKVIQSQSQYSSSSNRPEFNQLLDRIRINGRGAFWYWDKQRHKACDKASKGDCCFNHVIGLPRKNGIEKPIFDYEKMLYKALLLPGFLNSHPKSNAHVEGNILYPFKEKHLWIKKATGLGVTEFMLRFMA